MSEGMSDDELYWDMRRQRDELRALNAELVSMLETLNAWSNNSQQQVWCEARAAIAKAKEELSCQEMPVSLI